MSNPHSTFAQNYCQRGETPSAVLHRVAGSLSSNDDHFLALLALMKSGKFWPSGRILANVGTTRNATPVACFASGPIADTLPSIMQRATEAATTMGMTGSMGYDFSTLRPEGMVGGKSAAGPVEFMRIYDAVGGVIKTAGNRRGVQMGTLRVDHPDIEGFLHANFGTFHKSIAITDEFMEAVMENGGLSLTWQGRASNMIPARTLWEAILRRIYTHGEPRLLFIDRINRLNPLSYAETIATTNPWMEQPLPAFGSCPLGTVNLAAYPSLLDFRDDAPVILEAMDNLIERASYPLKEQATTARATRRVGIGVMGAADMFVQLGDGQFRSGEYMKWIEDVLTDIRTELYRASHDLGEARGPFPMAPSGIKWRNSHLMSLAPTGTISAAAGVTPGIAHPSLTPLEQVELLCRAQALVDGGVASTVVAPKDIPWENFKQLFVSAYAMGAKSLHVVAS